MSYESEPRSSDTIHRDKVGRDVIEVHGDYYAGGKDADPPAPALSPRERKNRQRMLQLLIQE